MEKDLPAAVLTDPLKNLGLKAIEAIDYLEEFNQRVAIRRSKAKQSGSQQQDSPHESPILYMIKRIEIGHLTRLHWCRYDTGSNQPPMLSRWAFPRTSSIRSLSFSAKKFHPWLRCRNRFWPLHPTSWMTRTPSSRILTSARHRSAIPFVRDTQAAEALGKAPNQRLLVCRDCHGTVTSFPIRGSVVSQFYSN